MIDLISDTVTKPSPKMLQAMFDATVGDDVFGEDPGINELEAYAAELFAMENALFCPSGTMTNQIAIKVHTNPGYEVICDATSHIYNYEGGGISVNSGVQARLIQGDRGRINPKQIEDVINAEFDWLTRSKLVSIENTANKAGGSFYSLNQMQELSDFVKSKNLSFHMDGARFFNAATEAHYEAKQVGPLFDSISICLSKGLGAPVGSLLIGNKAFIKEARRIRKRMGGGMRQAGFLAAAGLYALKNNITRLKEDHSKAKAIAIELEKCAYAKEILPVETNIVIFELNRDSYTATDFTNLLLSKGIRVSPFGGNSIRMVTHLDFSDNMLENAIRILKSLNK